MNYEIWNLKNYPQNGKHQEVHWNLPLSITKGKDRFYWNIKGKECHNRPNKWVVCPDKRAESDFGINFFTEDKIKQFSSLNKAIAYAEKLYRKWLEKRLTELHKNNIKSPKKCHTENL